ncbi:MAG: aminotransferase class V-fold PLP-dependent enzyme [Christensenellales bacterium]
MITDLTEHSSVYETFRHLEQYGAEVTLLRRIGERNYTGSAAGGHAADTRLVSVMQVNNETGAVNDIEALAKRPSALRRAAFSL